MVRKFVLSAAAVAVLVAGALSATTTTADAKKKWGKGWGKWHHGKMWHGHGFYGPHYAYYGGCLRRVWVDTPYGPRRRTVNVCY